MPEKTTTIYKDKYHDYTLKDLEVSFINGKTGEEIKRVPFTDIYEEIANQREIEFGRQVAETQADDEELYERFKNGPYTKKEEV